MRSRVEWLLRLAALGLFAWALVGALGGGRCGLRTADCGPTAHAVGPQPAARSPKPGASPLVATLDTVGTSRQLEQWTRRANLAALHLELARAPDALARDWLRAIGRAGSVVTWSGDVPVLAISADPVADPRGGVRVSVAAPSGASVVVADGVGTIDSLQAARGGGAVRAATLVGGVTARAGNGAASAAPAGARTLREVVVLGRAGWEAKFVAAALEEQGWRVAVRMPIAPGLATGERALTLDTARVSAVVALDSTAARDAATIARFVRSGGGVLLGAEAARVPAFASLAAGRTGATTNPATTYAAAIAPVTRQTLALAPIVALRPDAIALERREGAVALAARRVEAGRVVQLGYEETWRWRMAGADEAPDAHRRWWSELVAAVAYAPVAVEGTPGGAGADGAMGDRADGAAPRAALVAALGEPSPVPVGAGEGDAFDPSRSLLVYLAVALLLLAEWASRRFRGAK